MLINSYRFVETPNRPPIHTSFLALRNMGELLGILAILF